MNNIDELVPPDLVHLPDLYVSRKGFMRIVRRELDLEITFIIILFVVFVVYVINRERKLREYEKRLKELSPKQ